MNSLSYQKYCFTRPIGSSIVMGTLFTGLDVAQGARFVPKLWAINIGGLYLYNILQCPMEAVHGRQSAWHNVASASLLGYIGVSTGYLGIPFVPPMFFYRYPFLRPPLVGAGVYGAIGCVFASVLGGKPF